MTSSLSKRLTKLEEAVASRTRGPKTIRRVIAEAGEGPDELVICRVIVTLRQKTRLLANGYPVRLLGSGSSNISCRA